MGIFFALCLSAGSSLASALATRNFLGQRHDRQLKHFDTRVTGEIEASIELYNGLKNRMTSVFDALDERDATAKGAVKRSLSAEAMANELVDEELTEAAHAGAFEIEQLEQSISDLEARLSSAEGGFESVESRAAGLETDLHESRAELGLSQANAQALQAELDSIRAVSRAAQSDAEGILALAEDKFAKLEELSKKQQARLTQSDAEGERRDKQLTKSVTENDHLQALLEQVEQAKADLAKDLSCESDKASERGQRIEELERSLVSASGEVDDQRQAVIDKISTFQEAQKMLDVMRPMLADLEDTLRQDGDTD
jgi:chromosome segregation ATPase